MVRVIQTGAVGITTGFKWKNISGSDEIPAENDIDADNDGVMSPSHGFLIDLSHIASKKLGMQAPMMATYKVRSIRVGLRPVDDIVDNDESTSFAGYLYHYPVTEHLKDALRLARATERHQESGQVDKDSLFLSTENDYSGFRYGWSDKDDVQYQTVPNEYIGIPEWSISSIGYAYGAMEGRPTQDNALWSTRFPQVLVNAWSADCSSGIGAGDSPPEFTDDTLMLHINTLPLIAGRVVWSSLDEVGAVDDDYTLHVTVDFEVGGVF